MRIEFIAGILIFAIILVFIVSQTNITFSNLLTDSRADILKTQAINSITILVEDGGSPSNWESFALSSPWLVERVGLASSPLELSSSKISGLYSNCDLLENFDLGSYRLRIYDSDNRVLFCGYETLEPPTAIEVRYVKIGSEYGNVTLELW